MRARGHPESVPVERALIDRALAADTLIPVPFGAPKRAMSDSVLILDGDPTFAENAQKALEAAGMTVEVRFDASLDDLRALRPRVLVLSAELPRGSGFGICSRIRRDPGLRGTAIFMTTSEATPQALSRHARSSEPANDYARKDIPMADLVDRVGRLLAAAPTLMTADPHDAPHTGPTTDRLQAGPPPLPMRSDSLNGETVGPTSGSMHQMLELWPVDILESDLRQATGSNDVEPPPSGRTSPEERIDYFRQLVKKHEERERVFNRLWEDLQARGRDLARRLVNATAELAEARAAATEARKDQAAEEQRRRAVQTEFQTFEKEIRRIFSEKDEEDQQRRSELAQLRVARSSQSSALEEAKEQRALDQRRISLLQEELEQVTSDKEQVLTRLMAAEGHQATADNRLREVNARLQTSEHVARERGQALEAVKDELDQLRFERETELAELNQTHQQALAGLVEQHTAERTAADAAHLAELTSMRERYDRLLGQLEEQLQATIESKECERRDELAHVSSRYERQMNDLVAAHESALARLHREQDEARQKLESTSADLTRARSAAFAAKEETDQVRAQMTQALEDADARNRQLQQASEEASRKLEGELETLRSSSAARQHALEEAIEALREEAEGLRAAVDIQRASHDALQTEADVLREELSEARGEVQRLERRVQDAQAQATRAEETAAERSNRIEQLEAETSSYQLRLKDAEALLEAARRRLVDTDQTVRRLQSDLSAAGEAYDKQRLALDELQQVQEDLTGQLSDVSERRASLEQGLAEAKATEAELKAREADLIEQVAKVEGKLASADLHRQELSRALAAREQAMGALQTKVAESRERLHAADEWRSRAEIERETAASRERALKKQVGALQEDLNQSRFAGESIRNALQALLRDLDTERQLTASPRVIALVDRVERVMNMSLETLDGDDSLTDQGPAFGNPGSGPTDDQDVVTYPFGLLSVPVSTSVENVDGDDEGHVTEVIDLKAT